MRDNFSNGNNAFPFITNNRETGSDVKLHEDQYEVYVNENLIGYKSLKNPGEDLSDIDDFLHHQGINDFSSSLSGDHYIIHAESQEYDVANALTVYFNNR